MLPDEDEHQIHRQNMLTLVFIGVLILLVIWLVDGYGRFIKMEKCIESRRHNCAPVDMNPT